MNISPINFKKVPIRYAESYKTFATNAYKKAGANAAINVKITPNTIDCIDLETSVRKKAEFDDNGNMKSLSYYKPTFSVKPHAKRDTLDKEYFYHGGISTPTIGIQYYPDSILTPIVKEVTVYDVNSVSDGKDNNFDYEREIASIRRDKFGLAEDKSGKINQKFWRKINF